MINKALIYIFLIILLIIVVSWYFSEIFLYLVISLIIATILRPLVNNLNQITIYNISMPRALAILLSFGILIMVLSLFTLLFVPLISDQIEVLSAIRLENVYTNLSAPIVTL
ncbi:MAG: AI-2E family transporter, partial [Cytophagales bacterium]|nr:AI-2E family transporter [Cytophagales bacterium]